MHLFFFPEKLHTTKHTLEITALEENKSELTMRQQEWLELFYMCTISM